MTQPKFELAQKLRIFKRPTTGQFILVGIGLVLAVALYVFLSGFVACWRLTSLPGVPLPACSNPNPNPEPTSAATSEGTPVAATAVPTISAPQAQLPAPWDGASRVNILVMGYDYGDWSSDRKCPCHTDTMIVFTIDPLSRTAGMLSIPRDMWVAIPGFDTYSKINAANFLGDQYKLPGRGSDLARKTVENFLGISIQYYALLDFTAFEKMIDTIGGIDVNVPAEIVVDPLGPHNTTTLQPGMQHFDGPLALAYARMRYTANGDVDRAGRQQQVILAVRDKLLKPGNFLNLISQAPTLYSQLSGGINTNLPLNDAMRLAVLAIDIPLDQIQNHVIDYTMSAPGQVTVDGQVQDILKPFPDQIRALVDQVFGSGSMKPAATGDPTQLMVQEAARVLVINGSGVNGIASKTADYLKAQGMNVIGFGNMVDYPDQYKFPPLPNRTMLIVHAGKPYVMEYLMALMKFSSGQLVVDFDPTAPADVILAVGADWANNNPMP